MDHNRILREKLQEPREALKPQKHRRGELYRVHWPKHLGIEQYPLFDTLNYHSHRVLGYIPMNSIVMFISEAYGGEFKLVHGDVIGWVLRVELIEIPGDERA